jgi:ornithine cyclodeaminase
MPAWEDNQTMGVKLVTVNPNNKVYGLETIQGIYIYMNAKTGVVEATMDGKALTSKRTAATSALASSFLSKKSSDSLLMVGTGALSIELIEAHASVRPISKVFVWGRDYNKAKKISELLSNRHYEVHPIKTISEVVSEVDIISCATMATEPLIFHNELGRNQHIDLVGSYKKNMREADDALIKNCQVFIDTKDALHESGDLSQPLENGIITESDIVNDLFGLCKANSYVRERYTGNTVFKSVGYAMEDLVAANYYFEKYMKFK